MLSSVAAVHCLHSHTKHTKRTKPCAVVFQLPLFWVSNLRLLMTFNAIVQLLCGKLGAPSEMWRDEQKWSSRCCSPWRKMVGMIWKDAVLNLKTQTCGEALSFTCTKRCKKPTKAQTCQDIKLSRLSEANIRGKGNKIRMTWADKGNMILRKVLKLKRSQNLETVMRHSRATGSQISGLHHLPLSQMAGRSHWPKGPHECYTGPGGFQGSKGSRQKCISHISSQRGHETLVSFQASKAWVFPVCTWPEKSCRIQKKSHRGSECFKGSPESGPGRSPANS